MPKTLSATVAVMLAAAAAAHAQQPLPLLSVDVELGDFGISDAGAVMRGRISIAYATDGPRITVHFLRNTPDATPPPQTEPVPLPRPPADAPHAEPLRALWVWNTSELLADETERSTFLAFVEAQAIGRVFLYLPAADGLSPSAGYIPFDGSALAPLIAQLRARGALTYGLDGDPDYVNPENHEGVLRTVRLVAEHNRTVAPEQRFHGVRYDVEPYLVRGFQGPRRGEILENYVRLIVDIAAEAKEAGLAFGVDIPFWFDGPDEETGESFEAVVDGERRLVLEHVMSRVDDVAIMAYRTSAEGPDGVLTHASGELALGRTTGAGVFVGVETTHLFDEDLYTFRGRGGNGLPTLVDAPWIVLEGLGPGRARIWFAEGAEALAALARETRGSAPLRYWFAGRPSRLPGDKMSFHALGWDAMESVTNQVLRRLAGHDAFLGLAFHDYRGLKELLDGN